MKRQGWMMLIVVLMATTALSSRAEAPGRVDWGQVLSSSAVSLPEPRGAVVWGDDFQKAVAEARRENRPVFVTLRCLPCKQCSSFDQDVLEGGPELSPLLRQFVTVRLTDAKAIDLRYLPVEGYQDLDVSWWGYFLSPDGRLYGVFGGKDHVSDSTRISEAALVNTLRRVLAHHYDPRRATWGVDGPAPVVDAGAQPPTKLPGFEAWAGKREEFQKQSCLHCHQIAEVLRDPAIVAGKFDKLKDTQVWPLPENVGITLDRDHGLLVAAVEAGSPAFGAGIRAGDILGAAGGRKLFGQADFRGALHRGPQGAGTIAVVWQREGKVMSGDLLVSEGWRKTVLDWRMSISQGNIGADAGFFPLAASKNDRAKAKVGEDAMAVKPFMYKEPTAAAKAGLKSHHLIVAVNGESPNVAGRSFQWWFRQQFDEGDDVKLTVRDGEKTKEIMFRLPTDH